MAGDAAQPATPSASQALPRMTRGTEISRVGDLTAAQVAACADVWQHLVSCDPNGSLRNGTPVALWELVFKNGWTSSDVQRQPPKLPKRSADDSMLLCRTFNQDLPVPVRVPLSRLHGTLSAWE